VTHQTAPAPVRRDPRLAELPCEATQQQYDHCLARGQRCELLPPPRPNPCRNQGTRCQDREPRKAGKERCGCYCGDEYSAAHDRLNPGRDHDEQCREVVNLQTGDKEQVCKPPPELPR
jgi:hypothetical protein